MLADRLRDVVSIRGVRKVLDLSVDIPAIAKMIARR